MIRTIVEAIYDKYLDYHFEEFGIKPTDTKADKAFTHKYINTLYREKQLTLYDDEELSEDYHTALDEKQKEAFIDGFNIAMMMTTGRIAL